MNESKPSPLHIFLVEDDEHDRVAFRRSFKKAHVPHKITEYAYADEAFDHLCRDASDYDIVVSDYKLPGMNGLDFCRKLIQTGIPLPIVMLTGTGSEQLAVEALKAGIDDYIIKDPYQGYLELLPILLPDVVRKHSDSLARKRAEEALEKSEALLREAQDIAKLGHWVWDLDTGGLACDRDFEPYPAYGGRFHMQSAGFAANACIGRVPSGDAGQGAVAR